MGSLLHSYVKILREAGYRTEQAQIVDDLFHAAGVKRVPAPDTIKSWIKGKSKCRVKIYFDEGRISEEGKEGIINYFASNKDCPWEELKNKFASDEDFKWVDCKAEDQRQFYQSLLNEFLRCLNIPVEILETPKVKKAKEPKKERIVDIFYQCIHDYPIENFIVSDPSGAIKAYLFEDTIRAAGSIKLNNQKASAIDQPSDIDQKIIEFSKLLVSYMKCLKCHSETKNLRFDGYRPSPNMDSTAMEEIKRRRDELESLYTSLKEQVEQILDEEYEAKKRELKEKERQLWKQYDDDDLL